MNHAKRMESFNTDKKHKAYQFAIQNQQDSNTKMLGGQFLNDSTDKFQISMQTDGDS